MKKKNCVYLLSCQSNSYDMAKIIVYSIINIDQSVLNHKLFFLINLKTDYRIAYL